MSDKNVNSTPGNLALVGQLVFLAVAMFGFGFLLVPIYDAFCEITGLGGKTNTTAVVVEDSVDTERTIELGFVTTVNGYAPWTFQPGVEQMTIHPGGIYETTFLATNLTNEHKTAQAVPSVSPAAASKYFQKLECFCFDAQEFAPGETKNMPVRFIVESGLPDYVDTITLSYTFFDVARTEATSAPTNREAL